MSYSDVTKAIEQYGDVFNTRNWANKGNRLQETYKGGSTGVNPFSSAAYGPSSENIYGNINPVTDPRSMFSDYKPNLLTRGTQGLTGYTMGSEISPYLQKFGTSLGGNDLGKGGFNLGPSMAVRGYTNDMSPYTYTGKEAMGTTGSNMMMAHQLSKMIPAASKLGSLAGGTALTLGAGPAGATGAAALGVNPYVMLASLAFSMFQNKKNRRRAAKANEKVIEDINEQTAEGYKDRSQKLITAREERDASYEEQLHTQKSGRYDNQYGGNYNSYKGEDGMKFSPKELKKIAKAGRNGDTQLAHINPEEAQMLKAMGGSGTINPYTGLQENFNIFKGIRDVLMGGADVAGDILDPVIDNVVEPIFDEAGNLVDPIMDAATEGVNWAGENIVTPAVEGIASGGRALLEGAGDFGHNVLTGFNDLLLGSNRGQQSPGLVGQQDTSRGTLGRGTETITEGASGGDILSNLKQSTEGGEDLVFSDSNWLSDKDNPLIRENVEMYDKGGKANIVAEFTGNELIVNDQTTVEKGISSGNYAQAAAPIRQAMKRGYITPGIETHEGNPMPVDVKGNVYAAGGTLPFKVNKGAGIYDHATDQFKSTMTDKEIAMVAQNNINKWESNGMA
tara:strand:- start:613 stop:2469 length:1857 start_codon:yes stop_codon:yes gene_type:complete